MGGSARDHSCGSLHLALALHQPPITGKQRHQTPPSSGVGTPGRPTNHVGACVGQPPDQPRCPQPDALFLWCRPRGLCGQPASGYSRLHLRLARRSPFKFCCSGGLVGSPDNVGGRSSEQSTHGAVSFPPAPPLQFSLFFKFAGPAEHVGDRLQSGAHSGRAPLSTLLSLAQLLVLFAASVSFAGPTNHVGGWQQLFYSSWRPQPAPLLLFLWINPQHQCQPSGPRGWLAFIRVWVAHWGH